MKRKGRLPACALLVILLVSAFSACAQYDSVVVNPEGDRYIDSSLFEGSNRTTSYFKEASTPAEVTERRIDPAVVKKIKSDDDYWYADLAKEKKEEEQPGFFERPAVVLTILIIAGVVFLGALIWFLASSNIQLFSRNRKLKHTEGSPEEELTEDIHSINFEREIKKAIAEKNYALAVRLYFLQTLKMLSDKGLINYTNEKTNSDYLFQLSETPLYRDFFRLTRNFEYVWYGQFQLSPEQFGLMEKDFSDFKNKAGR